MDARKRYSTRAGYDALTTELARLGVERSAMVRGVAEAAAEGDRSENAEYIYGKRRLRQIDQRMRHVAAIIDAAVIVDTDEDRGERVFFGAWVTVEDEEGASRVYRLVGEHETDAAAGAISYRSPVGRALMGKSIGDAALVRTPGGSREFEIVSVRYA